MLAMLRLSIHPSTRHFVPSNLPLLSPRPGLLKARWAASSAVLFKAYWKHPGGWQVPEKPLAEAPITASIFQTLRQQV
jgi:hypothetical protein